MKRSHRQVIIIAAVLAAHIAATPGRSQTAISVRMDLPGRRVADLSTHRTRPGVPVEIRGEGFSPRVEENRVYAGEAPMSIVSCGPERIRFLAPALPGGAMNVRIEVQGTAIANVQGTLTIEPGKDANILGGDQLRDFLAGLDLFLDLSDQAARATLDERSLEVFLPATDAIRGASQSLGQILFGKLRYLPIMPAIDALIAESGILRRIEAYTAARHVRIPSETIEAVLPGIREFGAVASTMLKAGDVPDLLARMIDIQRRNLVTALGAEPLPDILHVEMADGTVVTAGEPIQVGQNTQGIVLVGAPGADLDRFGAITEIEVFKEFHGRFLPTPVARFREGQSGISVEDEAIRISWERVRPFLEDSTLYAFRVAVAGQFGRRESGIDTTSLLWTAPGGPLEAEVQLESGGTDTRILVEIRNLDPLAEVRIQEVTISAPVIAGKPQAIRLPQEVEAGGTVLAEFRIAVSGGIPQGERGILAVAVTGARGDPASTTRAVTSVPYRVADDPPPEQRFVGLVVPFIRGDCDGDGRMGFLDAIRALSVSLQDLDVPCEKACDFDDSGSMNFADAIGILKFIFAKKEMPAQPFPECGEDPTPDPLDCAAGTAACR